MKHLRRIVGLSLWLGLISLFSAGLFAETIRLTDGKTIEGKIVSSTPSRVTIRTTGGVEFTLPRARVVVPVADWLKEAKEALGKKDYARAADLAGQVAAWDPTNQEARAILDDCEKPLQEALEAQKKAEAEARAKAEAEQKAKADAEAAAAKAKAETEKAAAKAKAETERPVPGPSRSPVALLPAGYSVLGHINVPLLLKNPMVQAGMMSLGAGPADPETAKALALLNKIERVVLAFYTFPEEHSYTGPGSSKVTCNPGLGAVVFAQGKFTAAEAKEFLATALSEGAAPAAPGGGWDGPVKKGSRGAAIVARDGEAGAVFLSDVLLQRAVKTLSGQAEASAPALSSSLALPATLDSPVWVGFDVTPDPKSKGEKIVFSSGGAAPGQGEMSIPWPVDTVGELPRRVFGTLQLTGTFDLACDMTSQFASAAAAEKTAADWNKNLAEVKVPAMPGAPQTSPIAERFKASTQGDSLMIRGRLALPEIMMLAQQFGPGAMMPPGTPAPPKQAPIMKPGGTVPPAGPLKTGPAGPGGPGGAPQPIPRNP